MIVDWQQVAIGAGGFTVLSALARALPEPKEDAHWTQKFVYNLVHMVLSNYDKLGAPRDANTPPPTR